MGVSNGVTTFNTVKSELKNIGYSGHLLQEKYSYDDVTISNTKEIQIPLAAFAQWPPSYRNACIGVLQANGQSGPDYVSSFRALGAPMVFEVYDKHVTRYCFGASGNAIKLEDIQAHNITNAFKENSNKWNPTTIFRAKAITPVKDPVQLDFFDAGFLPALKGMVHNKLDRIIRKTLYETESAFKEATSGKIPDESALFRLVFRFLAAKIFKDRNHPDDWTSSNARTIIDKVQKFYGIYQTANTPMIDDPQTQQTAWDQLQNAFNFQNLSVEDLAFIYENTLVSRETRGEYGIHSTPSIIAELIVDRLPFEEIPQADRYVLEPCAGHGVFLIAALRRLRDMLPLTWSDAERHTYLRERLKAIEIDTFAAEVCRLSLTLADYPNQDGWQIISQDIFASKTLEQEMTKAKVVLCNPPFEDFNEQEKKRYGNHIQNFHKPYEVLRRVLLNPPVMLAFIVPASAIIGNRYDKLQEIMVSYYSHFETIAIPDRSFTFSEQETMLILASHPESSDKAKISTHTFWVHEKDREPFLESAYLPEPIEKITLRTVIQTAHKELWNPPLWEIWEYLTDYPQLKDISDIHRGIEWNLSVKDHKELLIAEKLKKGFKKGLDRVPEKIESYWSKNFVYLNMDEQYRRTNAHFLPWEKVKVIVNLGRISRGPWRIVGAIDTEGLVCYQSFMGIWPYSAENIYAIVSLINSPIINAALYVRGGKRVNHIKEINELHIPPMEQIDNGKIKELVEKYISFRAKSYDLFNNSKVNIDAVRLLLSIDSLILKAYDLPPRLERKLLDFFRGYPRPVPFHFPDYFPEGFKPCIPLHRYLEMNMKQTSVGKLLKKIEPIDSKEIHEFVLDLEERQQA